MIETPTSLHTEPINVPLELIGFGIALFMRLFCLLRLKIYWVEYI